MFQKLAKLVQQHPPLPIFLVSSLPPPLVDRPHQKPKGTDILDRLSSRRRRKSLGMANWMSSIVAAPANSKKGIFPHIRSSLDRSADYCRGNWGMPKKPNGRPLPPCDRKTKEEEEGTIHKLVPKKGGWSLPPYSRAATAKEKEGYNLRLEGGEVHKQEEERGKGRKGESSSSSSSPFLVVQHTLISKLVLCPARPPTVPPTPSYFLRKKSPKLLQNNLKL